MALRNNYHRTINNTGQIGDQFIQDIDKKEIINDLISISAMEQLNAFDIKITLSRLAGKSKILMEKRIAWVGAKSEHFSILIAEHIGVLGGDILSKIQNYPNLSADEQEDFPKPNNLPALRTTFLSSHGDLLARTYWRINGDFWSFMFFPSDLS